MLHIIFIYLYTVNKIRIDRSLTVLKWSIRMVWNKKGDTKRRRGYRRHGAWVTGFHRTIGPMSSIEAEF